MTWPAEYPDQLPGLIWYPSRHAGKRGPFKEPPTHLVVHSGDRAAGVAEWFRSKWHVRKIWTQLAWSSKHNAIVQCDLLSETCNHVGKGWNDRSIGLELPGPWKGDRDDYQRECFRGVVRMLIAAVPTIKFWCRHSDLNPKKRDPGPGFTFAWMEGLGLRWWPKL